MAVVASWQIKNINGTRASLPVEIFDVQTWYTSNGYKPGVTGGGPDGQILNRVFDVNFFRARFFLPSIVLLFNARSFSSCRNLSLSETLPKSASGWGRPGIKVPVPRSTVYQ
ncbi:hypothetical protein OIU74_017081 [Salix koriyanagi]|uniref:Uncharacterized protein n=1 Tax=Salix koriyanagi TaxID=2511006 RepID=A0A9Q0SSW9_9ROSI|nr:hypothetical protein OIU74_017081 [Salix koriyanagi]